jgi:uncharacterized phage-like protein YoqJ
LNKNITACFTGHRPNKLGGYDLNSPGNQQLISKVYDLVENIIVKEKVKNFISGGALGADQIGFWCVQMLKEKYPEIINILATPFQKQDAVWSLEQKKEYKLVLQHADKIINVEELEEYKTNENTPFGEYSNKKMQKRNEYMIDNSLIVIGIFDGSKGGTYNCIEYAKNHPDARILYRIDPSKDFKSTFAFL